LPPAKFEEPLYDRRRETVSQDPGRHADHDCIGGNIPCNDGPGADDRAIPDDRAAHDDRIGADPDIVADHGPARLGPGQGGGLALEPVLRTLHERRGRQPVDMMLAIANGDAGGYRAVSSDGANGAAKSRTIPDIGIGSDEATHQYM